jgi:glycerophosphoryl diester phosphodiesterase
MGPLIIAHRGDSASRPENTLASFSSALEVGAQLVELDVQLTRDRYPVVLHDPTLDRTTSGRGSLREHTLGEVRALSAGYPSRFGDAFAGERIPTLAEALAFLRGRARVMVELKTGPVGGDHEDPDDGLEARAVAEVRKAGMIGEVAFLSFDREALRRCRSHAPEIPRGYLFSQASPGEMIAGAREAACDIVLPEKVLLSEELRTRVKAAGLKLGTWVVDRVDELRSLVPFDLYGVASNRPGLLLEALGEGLA